MAYKLLRKRDDKLAKSVMKWQRKSASTSESLNEAARESKGGMK